MRAAAAVFRSCVLFCCGASGRAVPIVMATMESRSVRAEVMLIVCKKSIIRRG